MDNLRYICQLKILTVNFLLIVVLFSSSAFSSNITTMQDGDTRFVLGGNDQNDIVVQALKNSQNVSFNHFSDFDLFGKSLSIYNGSILSNGSPSNDASTTIVIQADNINLSEEIKIIGAPADLLIISPNNISCSQCRFDNVGRVTIANGDYSSSSAIGNITTRVSGAITVNSLTAPGIQSVEFIAENINLSGTINTNFRADTHPESGMIVSENGAKVIGGGGVNIYPGKFTIDYETLTISSAIPTNTHTISADIQSASIAVTSPNSITLPSGNHLNTANDALSSSVRNGEFYAPLEGVFLSTIKNTLASITINGDLVSDNKVYLKANNNITFSASNSSVAKYVELIARNTIVTSALLQVTDLKASAATYINTGDIAANTVLVDVSNNIFNSFGGVIQAKKVTLIALNGYVTNGSRSDRINYSLSEIDTIFDPSLNVLEWGLNHIPNAIPTSGNISSNLSAHILANEINIDSKWLENINPYRLNKGTTEQWDSGISINSHMANQVSIQAENTLKVKALNYVLNSSAIMGLNQAGNFEISTPLLSNARYHLTADTFQANQLVYSPSTSIKESVLEVGTVTKITGYSPPGRLYSFGQFKFSALIGSLINSTYSNEFSFTEFFQDSYFAQTNIKSYGLELSQNLTPSQVQGIRSCLAYKTCPEQIVTTAEAETLMSFSGNVYGIDPTLPTQSDLEVRNVSGIDAEILTAADEYQKQFFYDDRTSSNFENRTVKLGNHGYVYDSKYDEATLVTYYKKCKSVIHRETEPGMEHFQSYFDDCKKHTDYKAISELLAPGTGANLFGNTGYTYDQISIAAERHVDTLDMTGFPQGHLTNFYNTVSDVYLSGTNIGIAYTERMEFNNMGSSGVITKDVVIVVPVSTLTPYIQ